MKKIFLPAALCLLLALMPLRGAAAPADGPVAGPQACWSPDGATLQKIRSDCGPLAGDAFEACFLDGMRQGGASSEAVRFAKSTGRAGYLEAFRRHGPVDIAFVVYPFRANENQGFVLVNGTPPRIDVDDLTLLSQDALKKDPAFHGLRQIYPALSLWAGDRSDRAYPLAETMPDGGQRFTVRYRLLNGCHACELAGFADYVFEFDGAGRFLKTAYAGMAAGGREPLCDEAVCHDPARPLVVRAGRTFTLKVRSNPTTGYRWELAGPLDANILSFVGREYRPERTDRVGAGGTEIWTFRAVGSGEAVIALKYVRPWEKDIAPADAAVFRIHSTAGEKKKSDTP